MNELINLIINTKPEIDKDALMSSNDLYGEGIVDSYDIFMLTEDISSFFNIDIGTMDLRREDFMTIESIHSMVKRHNNM